MTNRMTYVVCPACKEPITVKGTDSARVVSRKRTNHLQNDCPKATVVSE